MTHFYEGAYQQASRDFHRLLTPKTARRGYDQRDCVLWWRHARSCEAYHADNAKFGIPEPPRLDPLCGAAALASALQVAGRRYDKATLRANCRITGLGSSLQDLIHAANKMGMAAQAVRADDKGLMALPKPLIAHVERDHFVSVIKADKQGVTYLCADCGTWPGGAVHLKWKQWHTLSADAYGVITPKGGAWDVGLTRLADAKGNVKGLVELASLKQSTALSPQMLSQLATIAELIKSNSISCITITAEIICSWIIISLHCCCQVCCPTHHINIDMSSGATFGDPVNLATGEEEYQPAPDLTVYNPKGPSVSWQRIYNHLRNGEVPTAQADWTNIPQSPHVIGPHNYSNSDYGTGWSQGYNMYVYDPDRVSGNPQVPVGGQTTIDLPFTQSMQTSGSNEEIHDFFGNLIHSVNTVHGVYSWGGKLFTLVPEDTPFPGANFELRTNKSGSAASGFYDVVNFNISTAAPTGLAGTANNKRVSLAWNRVPGAPSYNVYRSTDNMTWTEIGASLPVPRYTDVSANLQNGSLYYYYVTALSPTGAAESAPSLSCSATPIASGTQPDPQAIAGQVTAFPPTGSDIPANMYGAWDVINTADDTIPPTPIATSTSHNGWAVNVAFDTSFNIASLVVYAPSTAASGTYKVRYNGGNSGLYGHFSGRVAVASGTGGSDSNPFYASTYNNGSLPDMKYLIEPNGASLALAPVPANDGYNGAPNAAHPTIVCSAQVNEISNGIPLYVEWKYDQNDLGGYYVVTHSDRSKVVFHVASSASQSLPASSQFLPISQIIDPAGNAINFHYTLTAQGLPLLSSITDNQPNAKTLLSIQRNTLDGSNNILSITDCYNRCVYYGTTTQAENPNFNNGYGPTVPIASGFGPNLPTVLNQVSQIVKTSVTSSNAPLRYIYGYIANYDYEFTSNGIIGSVVLRKITAPSPVDGTLGPNSTATIYYTNNDPNDPNNNNAPYNLVSKIVDSNGNTHSFNYVGGNTTQVTVRNSFNAAVNPGAVVRSYTAGYDGNMSMTTQTNGQTAAGGTANNQIVSSELHGDSHAPLCPSFVQDGNQYSLAQNDSSPYAVNGQNTYYGATLAWDTNGNRTSITTPRGVITNYAYTPYGNGANQQPDYPLGRLDTVATTASAPTGAPTVKQPITFAYYSNNTLVNGVTQPNGFLQSVTSPKPGTVNATPSSSNSVITTYTYTALGNVKTVTTFGTVAAAGSAATPTRTTTYSYDYDNGNLIQDEALGKPVAITDNLAHTTHIRYDALYNAVTIMDAGLGNGATGFTTTLSYVDPADTTALNLGQLHSVTYPATGPNGTGNATTVYDYLYPGGPLTETLVKDESGNTLRQIQPHYGREGELLRTTSGTVDVATYAYDALYRLIALKDANGKTTKYFYGNAASNLPADYLYQAQYPGANGSTAYDTVTFPTYDYNGNPLTRADGNNLTTTYYYDTTGGKDSLPLNIVYPSAKSSFNVHCKYDMYGRIATLADYTQDATHPGAYSYDDLDLPKQVTTTYLYSSGQYLPTWKLDYKYNPDGSLLQTQVSNTANSAGVTYNYGYDAGGRLSALQSVNGSTTQTFGWSYYDNNWLKNQQMTGAYQTGYTLNQRGFLTGLTNTATSGSSSFTGMTYDGAGNRTQLTAAFNGNPTGYAGTTNYAYDGTASTTATAMGQLTSESGNRSRRPGTVSFDYDSAGNPTTFFGSSPTGGSGYNADNQNANTTRFIYDGNGNPTTYNPTGASSATCTFDPENRMIDIKRGSVDLLAGYRADGLRAWKQNNPVVQGANATKGPQSTQGTPVVNRNEKKYFLYDGDVPVAELDQNGIATAFNTWGPSGLLARQNIGGQSSVYTYDPSGNVAQRLDASGAVKGNYCFDAFGGKTTTDTAPDPYQYGGQWGYYTDSETGLTLCGHRYYDSGTGRWLNRDPIDYAGGINLYAYCGNTGVNGIDPDGNIWYNPTTWSWWPWKTPPPPPTETPFPNLAGNRIMPSGRICITPPVDIGNTAPLPSEPHFGNAMANGEPVVAAPVVQPQEGFFQRLWNRLAGGGRSSGSGGGAAAIVCVATGAGAFADASRSVLPYAQTTKDVGNDLQDDPDHGDIPQQIRWKTRK